MKHSFTMTPTPPFDFDLTAGDITHFGRSYSTDLFDNGVFRRLLELKGRIALLSVRSDGTVDAPLLQAELRGDDIDDAAMSEVEQQVARMFGAEDDLAPFYAMAESDPHLSRLVDLMYGLHIPLASSVFESLVLAILGQQISVQVARVLRTLLIQTYGTIKEIDGVEYQLFPSPHAIVEAEIDGLRAIKFSQRKAEYIFDIASRVDSGELDLENLRYQSAQEAVALLTAIRGVGAWTAHWLLVRVLGGSDGFPHGDLALQRNLGRLVNGGTRMSAEEALAYSERWSPYRAYVTAYLFAATRSGRFENIIDTAETGG